jgi:hypothetical protein
MSSAETENLAQLARTTCGWRKPHLGQEAVRRYWRDVHSPAITRRAGVYQYRHCPFDPVRPDLFRPVAGVEQSAPAQAQLMWQSDVVYLDEAALGQFLDSPADPEVTALLLQDIEMIVDRSTTYKAIGANLRTWVDRIGDPAPQGPCPLPRYGLFFRSRAGEPAFRAGMRDLARRWSAVEGVQRLRMNLFEAPDMEAERKAGYPVKTHPQEQQYQAWIDLVLADEAVARDLLDGSEGDVFRTLHAYPVPAMYTFVFGGKPTLAGLRGYAAVKAINGLNAGHAADPRLLEWMYGPVVRGTGAGA